MVLPDMTLSEASDFLVALAIGLAGMVVPTEPPVPVATLPEPVLVEFDSWKRMWGELSAVADGEVVLALDGNSEIVGELNVLELEELDDVVEVELDGIELDVDEELGV